jgi:hypothetical protein
LKWKRIRSLANLLFHPTELLYELGSLQTLAGPFLDTSSPFQLVDLTREIEGLIAHGGKIRLEIPTARPIRTRVSIGEFEPFGKSSARRVYGVITGVWEIERLECKLADPERLNKKAKLTTVIAFTGLASLVLQVVDASNESLVACWKMELGDAGAPGCFFHTFASADASFPVPRHPNLFATPMSALDFAFGELFQTSWEQAVSGSTDAPNRWRSIQKKRLDALLQWQLSLVRGTTSSPWCSLKLAKPNAALFL